MGGPAYHQILLCQWCWDDPRILEMCRTGLQACPAATTNPATALHPESTVHFSETNDYVQQVEFLAVRKEQST